MLRKIARLCGHLDVIGLHGISDSLDAIVRFASDDDYYGDPDAPPEDLPGACSNVAEHIARHLLDIGSRDHVIVEGQVIVGEGVDLRRDHTWVEGPEGIIDPTAGQFMDWGGIRRYIPMERFSPGDFLSLCERKPLRGDWFPDATDRIGGWMSKVVSGDQRLSVTQGVVSGQDQ